MYSGTSTLKTTVLAGNVQTSHLNLRLLAFHSEHRPSTMADSTTPQHHSKTIYLIRHGVALHNIPHSETGAPRDVTDPSLTDPPLIRQGILQAEVMGAKLRRAGVSVCGKRVGDASVQTDDAMDVEEDGDTTLQPIELVVCSPLTRTIQTASYIFPDIMKCQQIDYKTSDDEQHEVLNKDCKIYCHPDVREAFGMHYPDKRRYAVILFVSWSSLRMVLFTSDTASLSLTNYLSISSNASSSLSHLKNIFPTVTYHPSITELDTDWSETSRETRQDVVRRVHSFFRWLIRQPHRSIAVVTHGVWMECALMESCPEVLNGGRKRVYNLDVYCGTLVGGERSKNGGEVRNDLHLNGSVDDSLTLRDVHQLFCKS